MPDVEAFAIACGFNGAYVDVSDFVLFNEGGVTRQWGRSSQFDDTRPGSFSFTLDNSDGRFTPGNGTTLATPLVEGMGVCWQLNDRLVRGSIRAVDLRFADVANGESARVRVSCDDALGVLSRTRLLPLPDQLVEAAGLFGLWKFNDDVTSSIAVDSGPLGLPNLATISNLPSGVVFGGEPLSWLDETQAIMGQTVNPSVFWTNRFAETFDYNANSGGAFGFWFTIDSLPSSGTFFRLQVSRSNPAQYFEISISQAGLLAGAGSVATPLTASITTGRAYYLSVDVDVNGLNIRHTIYLDGVSIGTRSYGHGGATSAADLSPTVFSITPGENLEASLYHISRLSHTRSLVPEYLVRDAATISGVLGAVDEAVAAVSFATLPAGLSDAPIVLESVEGDSALDLLNLILETEQGYVHCETSGTLTNPTEVVVVRGRDRPADVDYTFTTTTEILGQPELRRDLSNTVSTLRVAGPTTTVTVTDTTVADAVGNASRTDSLPLTRKFDLRAWGQDRINRGTNVALDVREFTVDARGTDTDRWDDLLAARPGDRIQVAGLPETQLGFSTFDGWLIGGREQHSSERNLFTFSLARALPPVAKYDTAKYMASGEITTNGSWTLAGTSVQVKSTGAGFSSTAVPYVMQVDDEQVNVTAVSGSPSAQTLTVTRGVNGTTAATHAGDTPLVGPIPESIYAF